MHIEPRKRPAQSRACATVDALVEATARILEEAGLDAVTTNAVAERAGVGVGSLYQYFPSKQALLAELLRRKRFVLAEAMERSTHLPFDEALDALLRAGFASELARPQLAAALRHVEATLPIDDETAALKDRISQAVRTLFVANGVADPDIVAQDVVALTRGIAVEAGRRGETDAEALLRRLKRACLGYLHRED